MSKNTHQIYIGIGSNINKKYHIQIALSTLGKKFGRLCLSPIYETEAVGFEGDNFYNMVAMFNSSLSLISIESILKNIENQSGRDRTQTKFSARTLDIDLLLYDDEVLHSIGIDIPRDEILKYSFVLKPLFNIAPELIHPQTNKSIAEHWKLFQQQHNKEIKSIKKVLL